MSDVLPVVAIIGRPNVGKSTLFNAFVGTRKSIVSDIAGTTRDSLTEKIEDLGDINYMLVDTAGLSDFGNHTLEKEIQTQAEIALQNADCIIWLLDGKADITQDDLNIAQRLRSKSEKVIIVANKIDDGNDQKAYNFAELGFDIPEVISAKNNFGFWEFTETVQNKLKALGFNPQEKSETPDEDEPLKIALVGRPNVGKSTLFNQLLGQERSVVSDIAGTTRDSIDTDITLKNGKTYRLIDTAGVRKKGKLGKSMEFWMSVRSQQSIERADVCILLIDSLDGVTHQDLVLAGRILEAGKGVIIGVNKFDLARAKSKGEETLETEKDLEAVPMWDKDVDDIRNRYLAYLHKKIAFLPWAPVLFFSGKTGKGVLPLWDSIEGIAMQRSKRIPTHELNLFARDIYFGHVAPSVGTKQGKIKYVTQADIQPPKFLFFVNNKQAFHFSYKRYIENRLREKYEFTGTPIQIELKDAMNEFRGNKKDK